MEPDVTWLTTSKVSKTKTDRKFRGHNFTSGLGQQEIAFLDEAPIRRIICAILAGGLTSTTGISFQQTA